MMNQYPLWKYLLLGAALLLGMIYALPNIYPSQPAISISAEGEGYAVDDDLKTRLLNALKAEKVPFVRAEIEPPSRPGGDKKLVIRFKDTAEQARARPVIVKQIPQHYLSVFNFVPTTPGWLAALGAAPMNYGLDLRGGVYFLIEVDLDAAVTKSLKTTTEDIKNRMVDDDIDYDQVFIRDGVLIAKFFNTEGRAKAMKLLRKELSDVTIEEFEEKGEKGLRIAFSEKGIKDIRENAVSQNVLTLRNRINQIGVAEPVVQKQGDNRIVVELPGVQDPNMAKGILNATATLEFRMEARKEGAFATTRTESFPVKGKNERVELEEEILATGDSIIRAGAGFDSRNNEPAVFITLDDIAGSRFNKKTGKRVGHNMAIVFIEHKYINKLDDQGHPMIKDGKYVREKVIIREVISNAVIRQQLGRSFQISGAMSTKEAQRLAILLQAGALAAPIDIVEERTVGPKLGQQNINAGFLSMVLGFLMVVVFMGIYYKLFGLVADMALMFNLILIVAIMSLLGTMVQASLTLPGIAGIVLTVGMAVDANVLIFERIREEIRNGNSPQASIQAGYEKALSTIADANITTLIAAVVLYMFGTGPIQGFAVTLSIGIATSMFTAIMGTRAIINLIYGGKRVAGLSI